ncbi:MAG TPA: class I SAM-dependent methyltransferase [Patescibacteria group bacterium]
MQDIANSALYLERMSKPLQEKLKIAKFIPKSTKSVLDIGCADGTVTLALADLFPDISFVGIDFNKEFIDIAKTKIGDRKNVSFEYGFLRERLAKPERFDAAIFCSVLHEFFSYGEGISTVVKALADAHEILKTKGVLIIRDMITDDYMRSADLWLEDMMEKISKNNSLLPLMGDFENWFGKMNSIKQINHFLLKYMYQDNWQREGRENYVPVSFEQYEQIFNLLGMKIQYKESYTIPFLRELWRKDFNFSEDELGSLRSTGIIIAQKN